MTEITLIAQDTSRYGSDVPGGKLLLPELLEAVSAIEGVHWVRVLYCYPDTTDDRLLDAIATLPKVAPYVDLPLQHINRELPVSYTHLDVYKRQVWISAVCSCW